MVERPMLALTIHQPYAWAIVHGFKRVENRSWAPSRDLVGGWLLIHAGKKVADAEQYAAALDLVRRVGGDMPTEERITRGALVGAARVVGVEYFDGEYVPTAAGFSEYHEEPDVDPWANGPICWTLKDAIAFAKPIACRGAQGIWDVPEGLRAGVRAQWRVKR